MTTKLVILETWMYLQIPVIWWLFKRYAKKDVSGTMIAGIMIGMFNEFATEPLWDYHLGINIYKDTPLCVVLGWGVMFTLVVFISGWLYRAALKKDKVDPQDKKVFLFDVLAGAAIAFPTETLCLKLGMWDYRFDKLNWNWGTIPFVEMPWEALVGYCLLMLIGPSFVRAWEKPFEPAFPGKRV